MRMLVVDTVVPFGDWAAFVGDHGGVRGPARLDDSENWSGGFYELDIELVRADPERLQSALTRLWAAARIEGCYADPRGLEGDGLVAVPLKVSSLEEHGLLAGTVALPSDDRVVCACTSVELDGRQRWLTLNLPLGALARTDRRIGAFSFGDDGCPVALRWRHPLDAWLGTVAEAVHAEVGIACAVIGFEVDAGKGADSFAGGLSEQRWEAIALPEPGGLVHTPANR